MKKQHFSLKFKTIVHEVKTVKCLQSPQSNEAIVFWHDAVARMKY